jgi:ribosome-associated protein
MDEEIRINNKIVIPAHEIQYRFSRSSGPGGQNVNKLSTKVSLIFDLANSSAMDEASKNRLQQKLATYLDKSGKLTITSQESRSQYANRLVALQKFGDLLRNALMVPKIRKKTKPTKSSATRRVVEKTMRGMTKKMRSKKIDLE